MPDNVNTERRQAEALSSAIDRLNQGLPPNNSLEQEEIAELLFAASLVKGAAAPSTPPPAVLNNIVEQAARTIIMEKRKKRLKRGLAGLAGVAAAAAIAVFLQFMPPSLPELQQAKQPQVLPAPAGETPQPPTIAKAPADLMEPPIDKTQSPAATSKAGQQAEPQAVPDQSPSIALGLPSSPVPAASDTMLALAERKADIVTVDAASRIIRQVYRKGAPDEIILTQAPKRANVLRSVPGGEQNRLASARETADAKMKAPSRNTVTVTIDDEEVTLEGAVSREELLNLVNTLTKVSIAQEKQ